MILLYIGGDNIKKVVFEKFLIIGILSALLSKTIVEATPNYVYTPDIQTIDNSNCFAYYSLGKVFIGDEEYLSSLKNIDENDILILDNRNYPEPNIKVYSSYKISDRAVRDEILEIICKYEEIYPSDWDRSIESMRLEWFIHNIFYDCNILKDRCADVDFNNNSEIIYNNIVISKILKF